MEATSTMFTLLRK